MAPVLRHLNAIFFVIFGIAALVYLGPLSTSAADYASEPKHVRFAAEWLIATMLVTGLCLANGCAFRGAVAGSKTRLLAAANLAALCYLTIRVIYPDIWRP